MPDFGLLQTPNFAQALMGGLEAGRAVGRQKRLDAALGNLDLSRPETVMQVLKVDPALGASLLGASAKMAEQQRETEARIATGNFLASYLGGKGKGGGQASGGGRGSASPMPNLGDHPGMRDESGVIDESGAMYEPQPGDPMLTAEQQQQEQVEFARRYPEQFLSMQDNLKRLNDSQRQQIADAAEAQATIAMAAQKLPVAERRAYIMQQAPYLMAHGVTQEQIAAFDPTDANISAQVSQALGVKGMLQQQDREADNARQDRRLSSELASRGLRDRLAVEARGEARVRFKERDKDRAAIAAGGRGIPTNTDDLDY